MTKPFVESGVPQKSRFVGQGRHLGPTPNTQSVVSIEISEVWSTNENILIFCWDLTVVAGHLCQFVLWWNDARKRRMIIQYSSSGDPLVLWFDKEYKFLFIARHSVVQRGRATGCLQFDSIALSSVLPACRSGMKFKTKNKKHNYILHHDTICTNAHTSRNFWGVHIRVSFASYFEIFVPCPLTVISQNLSPVHKMSSKEPWLHADAVTGWEMIRGVVWMMRGVVWMMHSVGSPSRRDVGFTYDLATGKISRYIL